MAQRHDIRSTPARGRRDRVLAVIHERAVVGSGTGRRRPRDEDIVLVGRGSVIGRGVAIEPGARLEPGTTA